MERIFLRGIKTRYGNILGSPDFLKEALKKYDRRKGNDPFLAPKGAFWRLSLFPRASNRLRFEVRLYVSLEFFYFFS
jgi:hypothetical protein